MAQSPPGDDATAASATGRRQQLRQAFLTGIAITIPALVTVVVFQLAIGFLAGALDPVVVVVTYVFPGGDPPRAIVQAFAAVVLVGVVLAIGFVADRTTGDRWARQFHDLMRSIPVAGSVYESFQEMSDLLLNSDTESFQEVKLVEFPRSDSYAVGFVTADTASVVEEAVGAEDLVTLYVPLAPNPVMGGFVVHVPRERVRDVDMSVEEGIQSIITSGVALDESHGVGGHPEGAGAVGGDVTAGSTRAGRPADGPEDGGGA